MSKAPYRLYLYDRMGGLTKCYRGNKGHAHEKLKDAREQAKIYLENKEKYTTTENQVLIVRYDHNWNSTIVEILSKKQDDEVRQNEV